MTSLKQIEANRRNAENSTGPRSEAGKQRSSRNAIRHGLTAETVIEPLEDAEDYGAFEEAIARGVATVIPRAKGFQGYKVHRGIESPERYVLQIWWDTLEDHTVGFRQSELFTEWRAIVGPFFASPPVVEHFNLVSKSV